MRFGKLALAMGALAALAPTAVARSGKSVLQGVGNRSSHPIWVTLYAKSGRGDKFGYGCLLPGQGRNWSRTLNVGDSTAYWVLAEVKSRNDCGGGNLSVFEAGPVSASRDLRDVPGQAGRVAW
jgi:hypothetical protein